MAPRTNSTQQTRTRLIQAATDVFARDGLHGATTREIARVAAVNEVTLFRHFANKEQLLAEVVLYSEALQSAFLNQHSEWTGDLRTDLTQFAHTYNQMLEDNEPLIRTFIGEAHRRPNASRHVLYEAAQALRGRLLAYLQALQEKGRIRQSVDLGIAIDQLTGMLLSGLLRRCMRTHEYSQEQYLDSCVELFLCGIQTLSRHDTHDANS